MKKHAIVLRAICALWIAGFSVLTGCRGEVKEASGKPVIAGILFQEDQFFRLIEYGMKAAAKEYDVDLMTSNSFGSLDKEISLVDIYITRGVDAIVVAPLSVKASIPALREADNSGIPVITYDGSIDAQFPRSSIKSDQMALGRTTGAVARKYIEEQLGGTAKIALIEYISLAPEPGGLRVKGFKDEIALLPQVTIVAEQDAWLAPQGADVVESILTAHPDIDLIWAANEGGTVGAVTAIRNLEKAGEVVVFGTDMSEQLADFLLADDNILQAVTGQKPYDIGFQAMESAVKVLNGEAVESNRSLPGILFTRDDPDAIRKYRDLLKKLSE